VKTARNAQQEGIMENRRNIFWVLAAALFAIGALNGCVLESLPLANSGSDVAQERPFSPTHHTFHR
jgi:hypothetical protein